MIPTSSFHLGSIRGIAIGIHSSWLLAAGLLTWSLARGWFPQAYPGWSEATYYLVGAVATLLLFASVLLHEFGHALTALRFGIPVRSVVLFIFGGVATLDRESDRPRTEFWIAAMGPVVSIALAGIFFGLRFVVRPLGEPVLAVVSYLATLNALLVAFNLIPGFPLDGGRLLRAGVWAATGDYQRATFVTSLIGRGVAFLLLVWGVYRVLGGDLFGGIWTAFIGWFLLNAATATYRGVVTRDALDGVAAGQLVRADPPIVAPALSLFELVYERMLPKAERAHLVVDEGRLIGLITWGDVMKHRQGDWYRRPVANIMTPAARLKTVRPDTPLSEAVRLLSTGDYNQLPVLDGERPVGLLSRSAVMRFLHQWAQLGVDSATGREVARNPRVSLALGRRSAGLRLLPNAGASTGRARPSSSLVDHGGDERAASDQGELPAGTGDRRTT